MNGTLVELSSFTIETGWTDATSGRAAICWAAAGVNTAENAFTSVP
jgi:hypothetical protein